MSEDCIDPNDEPEEFTALDGPEDDEGIVAGVDRPGYWDEIKTTAHLAAVLWPHVGDTVEETVNVARALIHASIEAIDREHDAREKRMDDAEEAVRALDEDAS